MKKSGKGRSGAPRRRRPNLTQEEIETVMIPVLERFFGDKSAKTVMEVAEQVCTETGVLLSREQVYRVISEGVRSGYVTYSPPMERRLTKLLSEFPNKGDVRIVNARGEFAGQTVASHGGDLVFDLMKDIARRERRPIHLAFGIGRSTMRCVQRIADRMKVDHAPPHLVVHAMSPEFSLPNPLDTPITALASLVVARHDIEFVGFPSQPVVPVKDYAAAKRQKFVREASERATQIDIVITSLASAEDEHGYLRQTLQWLAPNGRQSGDPGWVGDVHLRPYSTKGPVPFSHGLKPLTLFELEDLVRLSQTPDKHVVLLVAPCGSCQRSKAQALAPILREPKLRVWNHLVVDAGTASEVLTS